MKTNPLITLGGLGQSIWLDYIRRELISSGELRRSIEADGLKGMTSNPAIFEKAIVGSPDYTKDIQSLAQDGKKAMEIYETLSQADVRSAADEFRKIYDSTQALDGYVSLEVNPHLARDTQGTLQEARRLWVAVNRPNVCIKVPATAEGLPAIQQLISEGINVNVTLIFGLPRYRQVAEAYIAGLEARAAQGKTLENICSVASFFVSRIDVMVDSMLDKAQADKSVIEKIRGQVAIASAKTAYEIYKELFESARFKKLHGARSQRLLWASTATKNPKYSDVKYVEALIGADTVNTVPLETLEAYRDHGAPESRLEKDLDQASWAFQQLPGLGIHIDAVTQKLEDEGVAKFNEPFDKIMATLEKAIKQTIQP